MGKRWLKNKTAAGLIIFLTVLTVVSLLTGCGQSAAASDQSSSEVQKSPVSSEAPAEKTELPTEKDAISEKDDLAEKADLTEQDDFTENGDLAELGDPAELGDHAERDDFTGKDDIAEKGNPAERDDFTGKDDLAEDDDLEKKDLTGGSDPHADEPEGAEKTMRLYVNDAELSVAWEDNEAVHALTELASKEPLTIAMSMYGGFEQVGSIGQDLPRNDRQTTTGAGDIVLYSGDQIVVFYGSNSWSYTMLGHITDKTAEELAQLLGQGNVSLTISTGE